MQGNQEGILDCRGRIQGHYPIFPPDSSPFTRKLVHRSYVDTLHGGVALTITKVRELYWVPRLRALVKQVLRACSGCKQFQAMATPPPGLLPIDQRGAPHSRLSELILQDPSSTVSEPKQKERPILHCTHAVLHEDYSWKYYQTWRPVNSLEVLNSSSRRGRPEKINLTMAKPLLAPRSGSNRLSVTRRHKTT